MNSNTTHFKSIIMISNLFSYSKILKNSSSSINNSNLITNKEVKPLQSYIEKIKEIYPMGDYSKEVFHSLLMILPNDKQNSSKNANKTHLTPHIDMLLQLASTYSGKVYYFFRKERISEFMDSFFQINKMYDNQESSLERINIVPLDSLSDLRQHILLFIEEIQLIPSTSCIIIDTLSSFSPDNDLSEKRPDVYILGILEILPCDFVIVDELSMDIAFYNRIFSGVVCKLEQNGDTPNYILEVKRNNFNNDINNAKVLFSVEKNELFVLDIQLQAHT